MLGKVEGFDFRGGNQALSPQVFTNENYKTLQANTCQPREQAIARPNRELLRQLANSTKGVHSPSKHRWMNFPRKFSLLSQASSQPLRPLRCVTLARQLNNAMEAWDLIFRTTQQGSPKTDRNILISHD
jgi:hypothetical protein